MRRALPGLFIVVLAGVLFSFSTPRPASAAAASVTAGDAHTCALTTVGDVECWGANMMGQLGDGTTISRARAEPVVGLAGPVSAVTAGSNHTCALLTSGGVQCWGQNMDGQVGDGTSENFRARPTSVVSLAGVVSVDAGWGYTCAVTAAGRLLCWGAAFGARPVDTGLVNDALSVAAGFGHYCVVTSSNAVRCWSLHYPAAAGEVASGARAVAAGYSSSCVLMISGTVKCWGVTGPNPEEIPGLTTVSAISTGSAGLHTCALLQSGAVKCWGNNGDGQLGDGTIEYRPTPVDVQGLDGPGIAIAAGVVHTCVVVSGGKVRCWGSNSTGKLGIDTSSAGEVPLVGLVSEVGAGGGHTCVLMISRDVKCWGLNDAGQLGAPSSDSCGSHVCSKTPVDVPNIKATSLELGFINSCAITDAGDVRCWGAEGGPTPVLVTGLDGTVAELAAASYDTCALLTAGGVQCWDITTHRASGVPGLKAGVRSIAAGLHDFCVLMVTGEVRCWGLHYQPTPVTIAGLSDVQSVVVGDSHGCALSGSGGVRCWGVNNFGQLGIGTFDQTSGTVDVVGLQAGVTGLAAVANATCAIMAAGGVQCWGVNYEGERAMGR